MRQARATGEHGERRPRHRRRGKHGVVPGTEVNVVFAKRPLNSFFPLTDRSSAKFLYYLFEISRASRIYLRGLNTLQKLEKIHVASPIYEEAPQKLVLQNKMFCSIFVHRI